MRRRLLGASLILAALLGIWATRASTQVVQCGGAFVPALNCLVSGFWNFTKTNGLATSLPTPFQVAGVSVTGSTSYRTTLTNAQVLALGTTRIIVVPAPGANKYIDVIGVTLFFDYTGAYTGGSNLQLWYTNRGTGPAASAEIQSTFLTTGAADAIVRVTGTPDNTTDLDAALNAPVVLMNVVGANFGGGNASNTLLVIVHYRVVQVAGTVN